MAETPTQLITDLHVHSDRHWARWPGEKIKHSPAEMVARVAWLRDQALEGGAPIDKILGGVALTGHDTVNGVTEALEAGEELGVTVTPGVEVTTQPSKFGPTGLHLIVLLPIEVATKLEKKETKGKSALPTPMGWGRGRVAEWAHDLGGVVIAPHAKPWGDNVSLSYRQLEKRARAAKPKRRLDGMETVFPSGLTRRNALNARAHKLGLAAIGSSDAHSLERIGIAATRVWGLPAGYTSDDVLVAIRERRTDAMLLHENVSKDMQEGALRAFLRRARESSRTDQASERVVA